MKKLIFDRQVVEGGVFEHYLDIDPAAPADIKSPVDGVTLINGNQFLQLLNADVQKQIKGGWNLPAFDPNAAPGTTRWQALVSASKAAGVFPEATALNLK